MREGLLSLFEKEITSKERGKTKLNPVVFD